MMSTIVPMPIYIITSMSLPALVEGNMERVHLNIQAKAHQSVCASANVATD